MEAVSNVRLGLVVFLLTFFLHVLGNATATTRCSICGMDIKSSSHVSFETTVKGKKVDVCSFSCASKIHSRHPEATFHTKDYLTGERIAAKDSYFLVKSKALSNEVEFAMPPVIAAFSNKTSAENYKKRLGDGEMLHGLDAVFLSFN